jgi:hypothetical protein
MRTDIHPRFLILVGSIMLMLATQSFCATTDYAVEVSATIQELPPKIDFSWVADATATEYRIFRKSIDDTVWTGPVAVLDGGATAWTDGDVAVGGAYEYSFRKSRGVITDTVEVASGTSLTFTIFDTWGDGICCDRGLGSYEVTGCDTVYASGGLFGFYESTAFIIGTPESPCSTVVISITLDIFGEETSWQLTADATGDTLAEGGPYSSPRFGHILAGIQYTPPEDPGTVLLLVDAPVADSLEIELTRLELDMIREGYRVRRRDVPDDTPVPAVKSLIVGEYQSDPTISTLFIFGNIAVPYSGDVRAAHANHYGAWPADLYYGELDGAWTDSIVNETSASRPENHNVPGDGKFDQTFLPSDVDLQVGRVDLSRMPAFAEDEIGLLRHYLDKDHAFRTGEVTLRRRGLIDDNVGEGGGTAYACTGWRNFTAMFGSPATRARAWLPTLEANEYLCAYGCGGGSYSSCAGVATTTDFATLTMRTVFTMLMGSYFGDWDNTNNLMRAALGSADYPLVCFWAGRPAWQLHHMAVGYPIGYSARLTQNNHTLYMIGYGGRQIHTVLLGDPTLRLHAVKSPEVLGLECVLGGGIRLTWSASDDSAIAGYHVYRSQILRDGFARISPALIADTTYIDNGLVPGWSIYMVRAAKLESTASGTYFNLSAGIIDSIDVVAGAGPGMPDTLNETVLLEISPNPFRAGTVVTFHLNNRTRPVLEVYDVTGRLVRTIDAGWHDPGKHAVRWDGNDGNGNMVTSGIYFASLRAGRSVHSSKVVRVE